METDNVFEKQNNYAELFTSMTQYREQFTFWESQTIITTRKKTVVPPKDTVQGGELELELESKLEDNIENEDEVDFEQVIIKDERAEKEKIISGKSRLASAKIKKKKKRLKGKLKRKKRMRKYKGGCPNF